MRKGSPPAPKALQSVSHFELDVFLVGQKIFENSDPLELLTNALGLLCIFLSYSEVSFRGKKSSAFKCLKTSSSM